MPILAFLVDGEGSEPCLVRDNRRRLEGRLRVRKVDFLRSVPVVSVEQEAASFGCYFSFEL